MKKEIKDIFIELGQWGISPIIVYNILKDFIVFAKEDFEKIRRVYIVRYDEYEMYFFSNYIEEPLDYINSLEFDDLSVVNIQEITAWEKLINSLDSRENEQSF